MAARRVVDDLQKTIHRQEHVIDELVRENYELRQILQQTAGETQNTHVERFSRISQFERAN